MLHFLVIN
jgi:hypothetical protein